LYDPLIRDRRKKREEVWERERESFKKRERWEGEGEREKEREFEKEREGFYQSCHEVSFSSYPPCHSLYTSDRKLSVTGPAKISVSAIL
jgi:hypothetical protein